MKFKMTIPTDLFTQAEITELEKALGDGCLKVVVDNFPSWRKRVESGVGISAGEIFPQTTDLTVPVQGVTVPGFQLTISQVSNEKGRNFKGLCKDAADLLYEKKFVRDKGAVIFVQLSLDQCPQLDHEGISIGSEQNGKLLYELKRFAVGDEGYEFS